MNVGRKIIWKKSLEGHNFKRYMSDEKSADLRIKLLALLHVQEGKGCGEAAKIVKVSQGAVQRWGRRFAKNGLDGLKRQPGQGLRKKVKKENLLPIKEGILSLQSKFDGGRIRGQKIKKYLH